MSNNRYQTVSDCDEWTVWDSVAKRDLFPTKTGNRNYAFLGCPEEIAQKVADALNATEQIPLGISVDDLRDALQCEGVPYKAHRIIYRLVDWMARNGCHECAALIKEENR